MRSRSTVREPTGYGLGRAGWVTVPIGARGVTIALLRDLVEESYRIVAPRRLVAELESPLSRQARRRGLAQTAEVAPATTP